MKQSRMGATGRALIVGLVVGFLHYVAQFITWAAWDRALKPGEVRHMPWQWPIVSFPGFALYDILSGHDRDMFNTFLWVMFGNSAIWGLAAAAAVLIVRAKR